MSERVFWSAAEALHDRDESRDRLAAHAVRYGYEHTVEIRGRLEAAGVDVADVAGVADLTPIPILAKDDLPDLQAGSPPFGGMLAVPVSELRRIYRSPGGITDPEGREDDFWHVAPALWAAGFRPGQVVLNTLSYHLTPGGHLLDAGLRAVGCVVIPGGVGNSAEQVETAVHAAATGYTGTPQFLETLVERALETRGEQPFERALVTGGPLFPPVRERLENEYRVDVYVAYGTADAGILGYECDRKDGWHVSPRVVVEVVAPGTGQPAAPGEVGEVVVTSASSTYPLVRFGTGDLSALNDTPCGCGRTTPRLTGFLGRVGEGVKVRGMFVHPRQLASVLHDHAGISRYRGVVSTDGRDDVLTVSVEPRGGDELDAGALATALRDAVRLRLDVEVVDAGTLPEDGPTLVDAREHA